MAPRDFERHMTRQEARLQARRREKASSPSTLLLMAGVVAGAVLTLVVSNRLAGPTPKRSAAVRKRDARALLNRPSMHETTEFESADLGSDARNDADDIVLERELEARVLEVFCNDPILSVRAIDLSADGAGTIELTGWVHATSEVKHAVTIARGVPNVLRVVERLAVRRVV